MLKLHITAIAICTTIFAQAQWGVNDSVTIGQGYANQLWYSLANDAQISAPANEWDLAFELNGFTASIRANHSIGVSVWLFPNGNTSTWSDVDTAGVSTWTKVYNSNANWSVGALNRGIDPDNMYDLGWGIYNPITHDVIGDSLFIVQLSDGSFKKLWIENLSNGAYNFRYANLDNSNEVIHSLVKADFTNQNFAYYSLATDQELSREPATDTWDLLFTPYGEYIAPMDYFLTATGVIQNKGVQATKVYPVNDVATFDDFQSASFLSEINTIGYDWKIYDFTTGTYSIADSTVYFVQALDSAIWKLVFTGFGGSTDGYFHFTKEEMSSTSILEVVGQSIFSSLYPNPVKKGHGARLVLEAPHTEEVGVKVFNISGKIISQERIHTTAGLHSYKISTPTKSGIYLLQIVGSNYTFTHKMVVN